MLPSDTIPDDTKGRIAAARKELELPQVDYEATVRAKLSIARQLFDRQDHQLLLVRRALNGVQKGVGGE